MFGVTLVAEPSPLNPPESLRTCVVASAAVDVERCVARALCSISAWMRPAAARKARSRTLRCAAVCVSSLKPLQNFFSSVNRVSYFDLSGHTVPATWAMWMT